jgi:prepilin-type N-terminal cleavage/methylation domain-containing protein
MNTRKKSVRSLFGQAECGLTLIEMVLVIALTGIIVVTINPYIKINVKGYTDVQQQKMAIQMARIAMNRIMAELKTVKDISDITAVSSSSMTFNIYDENGNFDANIRYRYVSTSGIVERGTSRLAEAVQEFGYTYYTASRASTTTIANIRSIQIKIAIGKTSSQKFTVYGEVFPKNLVKGGTSP